MCLYLLAEKNCAAKEKVMKHFEVLFFFRFRDDAIICGIPGGDTTGVAKFISEYKRRALARARVNGKDDIIYTIGEEESCRKSVPFLDLEVESDEDGGLLWSSYSKPTSIGAIPLDPRSAQPSHVHSQRMISTRVS